MDCGYEERVVSIVSGGGEEHDEGSDEVSNKGSDEEYDEGSDEEYDEVSNMEHDMVSKYKQHLELGEEEAAGLEHQKLGWGWVLWTENERAQQYQIINLLYKIAECFSSMLYIGQYWGVVKVEEGRHHLSSSHLPFVVDSGLSTRSCQYRNLCRGHVYVVEMELGDDEEHIMMIGGVGRAYRNKQPESTPDLSLYTTDEFPMRDEAASCGFRAYVALPVFDVRTNQCVGVLEILSYLSMMNKRQLSELGGSLQIAGFRSTHTSISMPITDITTEILDGEISEMLKLVMVTLPSVYLAQVCVSCIQCTDSRCMEVKYAYVREDNSYMDGEIYDYVGACGLHRLQIDVSSFHSHLHICDINSSISKNPLGHYAQMGSMSYYFVISLQNNNHKYTILFYLREDAHDDTVQLLLRMVEMNLKTFKLVSGGEESQRHDDTASACESIESLNEMKWDQTINCRKKALIEIDSALKLMRENIPQLQKTNVWVSHGECVATSVSCLELALSIYLIGSYTVAKTMPTDQAHWIHIRTGIGMFGMVLASENKSCFCPKLSAFGIADLPLSHYEMSNKRDACFAICLQSSHTGDLVYVVEFFLYRGPATYEYIRSFLNFLLPMMKHELRSFKLACGKELGEELVVEVVEFSDGNSLEYSSASERPQVMFPIKFKSVQYSQEELACRDYGIDWCPPSRTTDLHTNNSLTISPSSSFRYINISSWRKGRFLGSGSFGTVYEGLADDGSLFAVKEVFLMDQGSHGQQRILQLEQEISLLGQFQHENIVRYLGSDKDDEKLYVFLELVTAGSLAKLYGVYELGDSQVSSYTRQILSGLNYLHGHNVVHRDIKCANILVDANGSVKLADFGLAKVTEQNDIRSSKGTLFWMAPEVMTAQSHGYGRAADIWSIGCTVLEMLTRQIPYSHLNLEPLPALFRIVRTKELPFIPSTLSSDARDFILKCLQVNPDNRPTAAQLLEHPFVKKLPSSFPSTSSPPYAIPS